MLQVTYTILWTVFALKGGGRHVDYLSINQRIETTRLNWISQPFVIMSLGTGKISVALLLLQVETQNRWRRYGLYGIMISSFIVCSITIVCSYTQCSPVERLWDPTITTGKCWNPSIQSSIAVGVGSESLNANAQSENMLISYSLGWLALMDFVLALFPLAIVWSLSLNRRKKFCLAALMGLGIFAGACAIVKTVQLPSLSARSDFTRQTIDLFIWNATEGTAILVAGCIQTLKPMFKAIRKWLRSTRKGVSNSYPLQSVLTPSNQRKPPSPGSSQEHMFPKKTSKSHGSFPGTLSITKTTEVAVEFDTPVT